MKDFQSVFKYCLPFHLMELFLWKDQLLNNILLLKLLLQLQKFQSILNFVLLELSNTLSFNMFSRNGSLSSLCLFLYFILPHSIFLFKLYEFLNLERSFSKFWTIMFFISNNFVDSKLKNLYFCFFFSKLFLLLVCNHSCSW